jgi:hypothetical protein
LGEDSLGEDALEVGFDGFCVFGVGVKACTVAGVGDDVSTGGLSGELLDLRSLVERDGSEDGFIDDDICDLIKPGLSKLRLSLGKEKENYLGSLKNLGDGVVEGSAIADSLHSLALGANKDGLGNGNGTMDLLVYNNLLSTRNIDLVDLLLGLGGDLDLGHAGLDDSLDLSSSRSNLNRNLDGLSSEDLLDLGGSSGHVNRDLDRDGNLNKLLDGDLDRNLNTGRDDTLNLDDTSRAGGEDGNKLGGAGEGDGLTTDDGTVNPRLVINGGTKSGGEDLDLTVGVLTKTESGRHDEAIILFIGSVGLGGSGDRSLGNDNLGSDLRRDKSSNVNGELVKLGNGYSLSSYTLVLGVEVVYIGMVRRALRVEVVHGLDSGGNLGVEVVYIGMVRRAFRVEVVHGLNSGGNLRVEVVDGLGSGSSDCVVSEGLTDGDRGATSESLAVDNLTLLNTGELVLDGSDLLLGRRRAVDDLNDLVHITLGNGRLLNIGRPVLVILGDLVRDSVDHVDGLPVIISIMKYHRLYLV